MLFDALMSDQEYTKHEEAVHSTYFLHGLYREMELI
jgi:hypothetical protein